MKLRSVFLGLAVVVLGAHTAAAASTFTADVTVNIVPPSGVYVGEPGQYQVVVKNTGTAQADVVMLTIALPQTDVTEVVHILESLGAIDSRCETSGTSLVCSLASLVKGGSTTVAFTMSLPQSSVPIVVTTTVTTSTAEQNASNNIDADTAFLLHPFTPIGVGQNAHNEYCTGTDLTSFVQCLLHPSSIQSHDIMFLPGGEIAFFGAPPQVTGKWNQDAGADHLVLEYYDSGVLGASFEGSAVGGGCFEGLATFPLFTPWVAQLRVCVQ